MFVFVNKVQCELHALFFKDKELKSSLYSRHHAEACDEWRNPSSRVRT